jgi:hypothetical protein
MTAARWVGVGESADANPFRAGAEARAAAVAGRADLRALIVFASASLDLESALAGIAPGDVQLVGCTTAGEIGSSGPADRSVVVMALGGEGFVVSSAVATGLSGRLREAGAEVAACIDDLHERPYRTLLLLPDGTAGNQRDIVRGVYDIAGSVVPLVGGGSGTDSGTTFQLYGGQVLRDAIVALAIGSDAPIGIGVHHGWRRVGEPLLVTRSTEDRVYTLNDRPALDVYRERFDVPTDPADFTRFARTHPLGLARRTGEDHARVVGDADFEDRSLGTYAEVPQGAVAWFMEGDADSVLNATDSACEAALAALGGDPPLGVLAFDCIARREVLGDDGIRREVARIGEVCGGSPVAGFYTFGEIARTRGVNGFHNQTLVVLALG